jgi:lysophospholipase L1-like esterase
MPSLTRAGRRRTSAAGALLTALLIGTFAALVGTTPVQAAISPAATADAGPPPASIAALGDSITRGFDACGWYVDCPSLSWTTGTDSGLQSHYQRIRAVNPAIAGHAYNDGKTGAMVADLPGQAQTAVSQRVQYVTVLMGANDACTSSESTMTSVGTFRQRLDAALATVKSGLPTARVLLVSIPDIKRLWAVGKSSPSAVVVWAVAGICQSMLAKPLSTTTADAARRDRVRQRVIDYNGQLAAACIAYGSTCKYDGGAVFGYPFSLSQVSSWDYFHPNPAGQRILAQISYAAGFGW